MKRVLYGGGFDIFHWMHLESIRRAKAQGDYLIVMVNGDSLIADYKKKDALFSESERADIIRSLKFVDEVIIKESFSDVQYIKDYNIDVFVCCEEWKSTKEEEIELMKERGGKCVWIPYLRSSMMPEIKDKFKKTMENKDKVLCEECHRLI